MPFEHFKTLVNLISDHENFQTKGQKKQAPVKLQLAVFLHKIGGKSNIFEICSQFGIAERT
ncbi:8551_t:CDS:1, partial [Funneliformis geosporum]